MPVKGHLTFTTRFKIHASEGSFDFHSLKLSGEGHMTWLFIDMSLKLYGESQMTLHWHES
jgi:hypothetical protein